MQDKRFGYFDDDNREYVITDPKTPWPCDQEYTDN